MVANEALSSNVNPFSFLIAIFLLELTDKDIILLSHSHPNLYAYAMKMETIETTLHKRGWKLVDRMGNGFMFQKGDQGLALVRDGWIYRYIIVKSREKI